MGDMADYYREWALLDELDREASGQIDHEPINSDSLWRTRKGDLIPIRLMDDSHLLNTINVLRGKSPIGTTFHCDPVRRREWLNAMANEAYNRGLTIQEPDEKDPVHE